MRPHVGADRRGQRVEGQLFEIVPPQRVAADLQQLLVGVHGFDHAAQLGALHGNVAHQALVAGEVAYRHAVPREQRVQHLLREGLGIPAVLAADQRLLLDRHGQVYYMGVVAPYALRLLVVIVVEQALVIVALFLQAVR